MCWDAEQMRAKLGKMQRGMNMAREDELLKEFPPFCTPEKVLDNDLPLLQAPAVLVDSANRVLLWHLPDILTPERQVRPRSPLDDLGG